MRKIKFSLTVQLILFITLIFIVPFAIIGAYFYNSMLTNLTDVEKEHVEIRTKLRPNCSKKSEATCLT